jgi:hypothetical protein
MEIFLMTVHQTGYNFHPNDRVWYFNVEQSSFMEGTCYQVEFKIYKKPNMAIEQKLMYLVALDDSTVTNRLQESELYISTPSGLVNGPLTPIYTVNYNHDPDEMVWVVDRVNRGAKYGTVYQTEIKIHRDIGVISHIKTVYYVSFNDNTGTVIAADADVFATANEAWASLGIVIGPIPVPAPTGTAGANVFLVTKTNSDSVELPKGTPVYMKLDGTIARTSNDITLLNFLGFVYDTAIVAGGVGNIVTQGVIVLSDWTSLIEDGLPLEEGMNYYVSSLGKISKIAPILGYSKRVGLASSGLELVITLMPTVKL